MGQNHIIQSVFYIKVLSIRCNLLNPVVKVKNRMVLSVLVVYPHDRMADGELGLAATQHHASVTSHIANLGEEDPNQNSEDGFY